jgi:GNAT superfamily N-acetyltransferase
MAVTVPTGYAIEPIDLTGASDEVLRPFVELTWVMDHEAIPEDPRRPFDAIAQRFRMYSSMFDRWRWAAWTADRELAGQIVVNLSNTDNFHVRQVYLIVHPEHRRRGIARGLLAQGIERIDKEGETRTDKPLLLQSWSTDRVPAAAAFARSIGATPGLRARSSQLDVAAIDRSKMREWASIDPQGYHLEWIDDVTPDRLMANVITAQVTMNTMPREGLQWEDWKVTPEIVREWERLSKERGQKRLMVIAIDDSTGETASFTEIFHDPRVPSVLHQGGTATVPAHRGKGLGKWVKAQMIERVLRDLPEARYIRTENAGSNEAMLAINVGMGFRPAWEEVIWQVPLADAKRALAGGRDL